MSLIITILIRFFCYQNQVVLKIQCIEDWHTLLTLVFFLTHSLYSTQDSNVRDALCRHRLYQYCVEAVLQIQRMSKMSDLVNVSTKVRFINQCAKIFRLFIMEAVQFLNICFFFVCEKISLQKHIHCKYTKQMRLNFLRLRIICGNSLYTIEIYLATSRVILL